MFRIELSLSDLLIEILFSVLDLNPGQFCIGEGNGNPLQYSCLENPMDRGAWRAAVPEVAELDTTQHIHTEQRGSGWSLTLVHTPGTGWRRCSCCCVTSAPLRNLSVPPFPHQPSVVQDFDTPPGFPRLHMGDLVCAGPGLVLRSALLQCSLTQSVGGRTLAPGQW